MCFYLGFLFPMNGFMSFVMCGDGGTFTFYLTANQIYLVFGVATMILAIKIAHVEYSFRREFGRGLTHG
jgi:hypothetical protein